MIPWTSGEPHEYAWPTVSDVLAAAGSYQVASSPMASTGAGIAVPRPSGDAFDRGFDLCCC
ncbi:hypothetical protein I3679_019620 [Proteus mirabilis]|uniref:Uncharacterized protein n=1 Tax=Proteus mirabilis TaxID=584 RepID=A0ABD5LVJ5_PROMI